MIAALAAALVLVAPTTLDLPPEIVVAAIATEQATRGTAVQVAETAPPPPAGYSSDSLNGRCVGALDLLEYYSPGWSASRMAAIMYRESRCDPTARNRSSSATGLLQILASHCAWLARQMGTWCTRARLTDPTFNIAAAAVLWAEQGYSAWSTS